MKIKKQALILYKYNDFNNDYEYIKEYYKKEEITSDLKLKNKKSIYQYIYTSIENIEHKIDNKYIIIKEDIEI